MPTLKTTILLRKGEFSESYVLQDGEPGYHTGTKELKIGDGSTPWGTLGFANKTQIEALIKVVDDKIADLDNTYATNEELEGVRSALDAAKLDKATYEAYIATRALTDTEINTAIGNVDAKFANYRTSADQDIIDNDIKGRLDTLEDTYATKTEVEQVATNLSEYEEANNAAVALKADKSVVEAMYTNAKIDELVQGAKDYAAGLDDADTKYGIAYDSDTKKITLVEGGTNFEIDATDFIKDGMIESVALSEDGLNLVITWNTDADKGENNVTTIPLTGLVDIYTGVAGDRVTVVVSPDDKISADLVIGSITKNYLDADVQTSLGLADSALQAAALDGYAKTADVVTNDEFTAFETTNTAAINDKLDKTAFDAFNNGTSKDVAAIEADIVAKANKALEDAKAYADGKEHKNTTYTVAATANALEFTVTPSEGDAQTVTLVAPDTGIMSIEAGKDIVVTPGENGKVTVAHADITDGEGNIVTGTIKDAAHDSATDPSFITGITVANGHVTGATVRNLADVLEAMEFIIDGGSAE